jgi:hypothetical protein
MKGQLFATIRISVIKIKYFASIQIAENKNIFLIMRLHTLTIMGPQAHPNDMYF